MRTPQRPRVDPWGRETWRTATADSGRRPSGHLAGSGVRAILANREAVSLQRSAFSEPQPCPAHGCYAARLTAASSSSWTNVWYGLRCRAANLRSSARRRGAIRIAMSCFARPVVGRPTRRARANSRSDDSGMSVKSMLLSGIRLMLFARSLARADDADGLFAMGGFPRGVHDEQDSASYRSSKRLVAPLFL